MENQPLESPVAVGPLECVRRIQQATNQHSLEALAECFHPDYQSQFPAHLERRFGGTTIMRRNWTQIFAEVPDIHSDLLAVAVDGDTVWAEWEWTGIRRDGDRYWWRGVTIQGVQQGRVVWVRLYMEPVQQAGAGPEAAIRPSASGRESA